MQFPRSQNDSHIWLGTWCDCNGFRLTFCEDLYLYRRIFSRAILENVLLLDKWVGASHLRSVASKPTELFYLFSHEGARDSCELEAQFIC